MKASGNVEHDANYGQRANEGAEGGLSFEREQILRVPLLRQSSDEEENLTTQESEENEEEDPRNCRFSGAEGSENRADRVYNSKWNIQPRRAIDALGISGSDKCDMQIRKIRTK